MELSQQWDQLRNPNKSETRILAHYNTVPGTGNVMKTSGVTE